jgi:ribonuclease P protein component
MREERLKGKREIKEVFINGKRFGSQGGKLFLLRNGLPHNRICFTFSKGFGNAVVRNRARRLGREAFRLMRSRLSGGYDLILLIYPKPEGIKAETLSCRTLQLETLFSKAGLLK